MDLSFWFFIYVAVFLLELVDVTAVSVALNKPTIQGTTFEGKSSDRAVDGDYNSVLSGDTCAHTTIAGGNWWIVDLQGLHYIDSVEVTNRDVQRDRLDKLTVTGYPGEPYLCPSPVNTCGYNAIAGALVTIDCPNNTMARYLKLKGEPSMTLCEVDVFGRAISGCRQWNMNKQTGTMLQESFINLGQATTPLGCFSLCQLEVPLCNVFNYHVVDGTCLTPSGPLKVDYLSSDADWDLYFTC